MEENVIKPSEPLLGKKKTSKNPVKTFKETLDNSPKMRLAVFAGIGIAIISIIFLCIIVVLAIGSGRKGDESDKLVLENIDEELANELERQITYSANSDGEQSYYSPTLDILINYNRDKYRISEGFDSLDLYIRNVPFAYNVYGSLEIYEVEDPNQVFIKRYTDRYETTEVVDETEDEEFKILKLKYQKPTYGTESEEVEVNHYIISKKVEDKYATIDFSYYQGFNIEDFQDDFMSILNSLELSPDNVSQESVVEITYPKMKLRFDLKKWDMASQSEYGVSLNFRNENETDPNYEYSYTSFRVYSSTAFGPIDENYLREKYIKPELESANEFYGDKELSLISDSETVEIDGVTFYKVIYSYDNYGTPTTREIYYGYEKFTGSIVEIRISYEEMGTQGEIEAKKVLETIEFYGDTSEGTSTNDVLGASTNTKTVEVSKSSVLGKLGVVHIFNKSCVTITVENDPSLRNLGGNTYEDICTAGFGSGFYISKDGLIATNAHVANFNPVDIVISSAQYGESEFFNDLASDLADVYESQGVDLNSLDENQFFVVIIDGINKLVENEVMTLDAEYTNYIEGKEQFEISRYDLSLANESAHKKATTVYSNEIDSLYRIAVNNALGEPDGIKVPDLTILKVENKNSADLPALKLADPELITAGEEILAIGFPGSADNRELFATEASRISTITTGTISAIKPNFDSSFNLIQIDASISHGNSGGPILNLDGDVVGVSTYGVNAGGGQAESADFNAGVSVEELIKIIDKQGIENDIGQVTSSISDGLSDMSKEHYQRAVEDFEKAIDIYPESEEVLSPLIKVSRQKIEAGEDKTPAFTLGEIELTESQFNMAIIAVVGISVGLLLILGVVFLMLLSKLLFGGKKQPAPPRGSVGGGMNTMRTMPAAPTSYTPPASSVGNQQTNHQSYMPPAPNSGGNAQGQSPSTPTNPQSYVPPTSND